MRWKKTQLPDIQEKESNPFENRKVGVSKRVQERAEESKKQYWLGGKKCPGCGDGFVKKSNVEKCNICNLYVHKRKGCTTMSDDRSFTCINCKPLDKKKQEVNSGSFLCKACGKSFIKKFNFNRHLKTMHDGKNESQIKDLVTAPVDENIHNPRNTWY